MSKKLHAVHITEYGDDWENYEIKILRTDKELKYYKSGQFAEETLKVVGIERVEVSIEENVTERSLRESLTVVDYCEVFPEVVELLDNHFKKRP